MTKTKFLGAAVKFTKKSANDNYPTVTFARLNDKFGSLRVNSNGYITLLLASKSDPTTTFEVAFRQNRTGTSATFIATSWPKGIRKPSVGRATEYLVQVL